MNRLSSISIATGATHRAVDVAFAVSGSSPCSAVADARAAASKCSRTLGLSEERLGSADYLSGASVLCSAESWT